LQSVAAYCFLDLVSPATSVVVGTARKPFIVAVSVVAFATPLSILNTLGILLCFAGVFWYTWP
jgi:drug/metabolite transporter (DMT)-like permease